jgi:hypothetical protein
MSGYFSVDDSEVRAAIDAGEFVAETIEVECIGCHRTIFVTPKQHMAYAQENERLHGGEPLLFVCAECWWAIQQYRRNKRLAELN